MKKEINILVGKNIRFYREQKGYTREKLAELLSVSPKFLYDCESGRVGISISTLKRACEVLGVSADRLLWEKTDDAVVLSEQLSHIPQEYVGVIEELIQKQLEIIALAAKEPQKKTRN